MPQLHVKLKVPNLCCHPNHQPNKPFKLFLHGLRYRFINSCSFLSSKTASVSLQAAVADMSVSASPAAASSSSVATIAGLHVLLHFLIPSFFSCVESSTLPKTVPVYHKLTPDFYNISCPRAEQLVASVTAQRFRVSPASGPATLRLFFHDCFVEGCDASILISPTEAAKVERDVEDNKNLAPEGFETVNMAKAAVEGNCPGIVSCADILAIAARDFVHLAGGPYYEVKKGRRDSRVSLASKVHNNIPRANYTLDELLHLFASKGLTQDHLVALSGAHTIGFAHCDQFLTRLYRNPDPNMDPRLLKALRMSCPPFGGNDDVVAPFDVQTPFVFDHMYYGNLEANMGLLATDQALYKDPRTSPMVKELGLDKEKFFAAFVEGMEKMGSIKVKKGKSGEIRRDCSKHMS